MKIKTSLGKIPNYNPDPILGLGTQVNQDQRPNKIDATIGVIKTDQNKIFIPEIIKHTWQQLNIEPVNYLSPQAPFEWLGDINFIQGTINLIFDNQIKDNPEIISAIGTIGGTGAIYSFLDFYKQIHPKSSILISQPSWPNHQSIANHLGYQVKTYQHLNQQNQYDLDAHIQAIQELPPNSVVLLHAGLGHNPTGVNPNLNQWKQLAQHLETKVALFDAAYLGLGQSFEEDCYGFNYFLSQNIPTAICVSFAKNAGLYNQRPGVLLIPQNSQDSALKMQRMLNAMARIVYSTPPAQGERVVGRVLTDNKSLEAWKSQVTKMNQIIINRRQVFGSIASKFKFVGHQRGLFSMLPLNLEQITKLKTEFGIYLTDSGRINIGGVPTDKIETLAKVILEV